MLFLTIKRLPSFPETGGENNRSLWVVKYVKRQISSDCQAFILVPALSFQSSNRFMGKYFIGWKICNEIRNIQTWFLTELVLYPWNEKHIRNMRMEYSCALCIWEHKLFSIYSQPTHCWGTVFRLEHMANTNGPYRTVSQCCELPEPRHLESNDYSPSLQKKCEIVLTRVERHLILWEAFIPVTTFTSKSLSTNFSNVNMKGLCGQSMTLLAEYAISWHSAVGAA